MKLLVQNKKWRFILVFGLIVGILTACSGANQNTIPLQKVQTKGQEEFQNNNKTLHIVCTTYPQYDWVKQILGEHFANVEVTYLLKNGVDIHSYQPSAEDMIVISDCDLLIKVGGQSEQWLEDALKNHNNQNQKVLSMMDVLQDRIWEEELIEGMQEEAESMEQEEHSMGAVEYDEHVWLSLRNAEQICQEISAILGELDSKNREDYQKNMENYCKQLQQLDKKYQELADTADQKILLFADRFPFRYLVEDYGWEYYAAFAGCSAETEASFETIAFLATKVDECNLWVVYRTETSDDSIAKTVINSTKQNNQKILVLDSLQAVTEKEINEGITYLSVMEQNLEQLKQGLQKE